MKRHLVQVPVTTGLITSINFQHLKLQFATEDIDTYHRFCSFHEVQVDQEIQEAQFLKIYYCIPTLSSLLLQASSLQSNF